MKTEDDKEVGGDRMMRTINTNVLDSVVVNFICQPDWPKGPSDTLFLGVSGRD